MKLFKAIFVFCLLVACKKEQQVEVVMPECILSPQEMVDVMVDITLVKSAKSLGRQGLKDSGIKPLEYIYAKHGVDTIVIRENLEYYNSDLEQSKLLYEDVAAVLNKRREVLKVVMDTIAKEKKNNQDEEDVDGEIPLDDDD